MSVDRCAVTAISSADGTAASAIQVAASRQLGRGAAPRCRDRRHRARGLRSQDSTPQAAISTISTIEADRPASASAGRAG